MCQTTKTTLLKNRPFLSVDYPAMEIYAISFDDFEYY